MKPIRPDAIFFLVQAGYPIDLVFPLCVQSINGLRNRSGGLRATAADEDFRRLVHDLRQLQIHGVLGMRVTKRKEGEPAATVLFFHQRDVADEARAKMREVRELLNLDPEAHSFKVRYSTGPGGGEDIEMLTRSPFTILFELATQVDAPRKHTDLGWTLEQHVADEDRIMRIHSTSSRPDDAFVAVKYEDHIFYVRKDDILSKRAFAFVNVLFSFVETGGSPPPTLVTVPS